MEGDSISVYIIYRIVYFNPLPPHGGRPDYHGKGINDSHISIHSLRMEGDFSGWLRPVDPEIFQSTPSAWRETGIIVNFQSGIFISIHSLRMEGDTSLIFMISSFPHFNPLPPHGGRQSILLRITSSGSFQSTPSAWRETSVLIVPAMSIVYFNPLPPHGGRRSVRIPAPAVGWYFNPLPPHGGRLFHNSHQDFGLFISIHSLRMEGDTLLGTILTVWSDFNPLPPHGGRLLCLVQFVKYSLFQSTPSAWRETWMYFVLSPGFMNFNPLPPHGGRQFQVTQK